MKYEEILQAVTRAARGDWVNVEWDDGVPFGKSNVVYRADVNLRIATSRVESKTFEADWTKCFSDQKASEHEVLVVYGHTVIYADRVVSVDGGRCTLPMPVRTGDVRVLALDAGMTRILQEHCGGSASFDEYMARAGLIIDDRPFTPGEN